MPSSLYEIGRCSRILAAMTAARLIAGKSLSKLGELAFVTSLDTAPAQDGANNPLVAPREQRA